MKRYTNKEISETIEFINKCQKYGVTPTKRQVSKLRNKKGLLYKRMTGKEKI